MTVREPPEETAARIQAEREIDAAHIRAPTEMAAWRWLHQAGV
ncbi:MAG: hypothetical protein ACTHW3_07340 [Leucobacter sp.]